MYRNKLNKIWNLIDKIKTEINLSIISDFLEWFYEKLNLNFSKKEPDLKLNKWEIYFVNLWKNIWSELNKIRPCIIYSWRRFNGWNTIIIIPLKSYKWKINNSINLFIKATKENNLKLDSVVDLLSIRQVSKKRVRLKKWNLESRHLERIDKYVSRIFEIKKLEN
jgi:mRNA-degrading endonuclease toxin of MazEF toxin-antitoxin module